jgi:hypothetical protein
MKKTFVILEQGCEPNYPLTTKHKEQFNTEFSDCFRLNWKEDRNDKNADFFKKDICWSEGRSYLYEQVKGKYDYYIFIDDDIKFYSRTELAPAEQIKESLETYNPIHGSMPVNSWPGTPSWHQRPMDAGAVTMIGGDMCIQFFSESFANLMFPTWCHGSQASMYYAQFLARMICPRRSIFLNLLSARNIRNDEHGDTNTTSLCLSYFRDMLISQKHKTMFWRWYNDQHTYKYTAVRPHKRCLNITAKDIEKYITKRL